MNTTTLNTLSMSLACGLFLLFSACAGGAKVIESAPAPAETVKVTPTVPFPDFRGERKQAGAWFLLQSNPIVIDALRVKVSLHSVGWLAVEGPDGKDVKEGTALIIVERDGADKMLHLDEGDSKSALGVRVTVQTVKELYDKDRLDFRPRVTLKVE